MNERIFCIKSELTYLTDNLNQIIISKLKKFIFIKAYAVRGNASSQISLLWGIRIYSRL